MNYFAEVQEVFDLFDFWDGRDGLIDAVKIGDLLRCVGLNPTVELIRRHGGTKKSGEYCIVAAPHQTGLDTMSNARKWG